MKRFIISEEEKKHIMGLYETLTPERLLSEQSMGGGFTPQFQAAELSKINNEDLVGKFLASREKIETKAKLLYNPANINNKMPYQKMKDREDAFCHQTASAYATNLFGESISYIIGQMNELKGAFRIFLKGGKNTPKYTKFNSGYEMDTNNNNLGIKLAKQFPNKTLEDYMSLVQKNINNGVYYNKSNKYMKT